MHDNPPPIWKAFSAAERRRFAEFDWSEWAVRAFRDMRQQWTWYFLFSGLAFAMFSCTSDQLDAQIEASDAAREKPKVDPWALDKPAGEIP